MSSMIYKKKTPLLVFLIPAFAFLIAYLYYPFVQNVINTFLDIGGLGRPAEGLNDPWYSNYLELFRDSDLRTALKNTVILTVFTVVFQVGIALILALLVDSIRVGAKALLSDPSLKIGQISEMVGYSDTAHFARTFKKLEGMSANEYRNSLG